MLNFLEALMRMLRAFSLRIVNAINAKFQHQVCKKHTLSRIINPINFAI